MQEGCEFLVAQHADGRMDLRDVYVWDEDAGVHARPVSSGEMPGAPARYVQVPWREEFLGDKSNSKTPYVRVRRWRQCSVVRAQPICTE